MSLNISIENAAATVTYNFIAETATHAFIRLPTQSPLPAAVGATPQVYTLDLGMLTEQITISGTVNTTSTGAGDPSKVDLEDVCRNWWGYTNTPGSSTLAKLTISANQTYYVILKTAEFNQSGGTEDRWSMTIIFLVASKK
jgi:hypothetical protein